MTGSIHCWSSQISFHQLSSWGCSYLGAYPLRTDSLGLCSLSPTDLHPGMSSTGPEKLGLLSHSFFSGKKNQPGDLLRQDVGHPWNHLLCNCLHGGAGWTGLEAIKNVLRLGWRFPIRRCHNEPRYLSCHGPCAERCSIGRSLRFIACNHWACAGIVHEITALGARHG